MTTPDSGMATSRPSSQQASFISGTEPNNVNSGPLPPQMDLEAMERGEAASEPHGSKPRRYIISRWFKPSSPFPPRSAYGYESLEHVSEETQTQNFFTNFIVDTVIAWIYFCLLLWVPMFYQSRVTRLFKEASLTMREIKEMALETAGESVLLLRDPEFVHLTPGKIPPRFLRLKSTWESFIDSVMQEWNMCNIVSVLLLSAILTLLQVPSAANDPVIRYFAIFSLICTLFSLLFGCMYCIRFNNMRETYKAAEWAEEVHSPKMFFAWNVYVFLAMPAVWLAWSSTLFSSCIFSILWRTSNIDEPHAQVSERWLLIIRILGTILFLLGFICGGMVLSTFSRFGTTMEEKWDETIKGWLQEKEELAFIHKSNSLRAESPSSLLPAGPRTASILRSPTPNKVLQSGAPPNELQNQNYFSAGIDIPSQRRNSGREIKNQRRPTIRFEDEEKDA